MLTAKVLTYINHKLTLASKSRYYMSPELRSALDWGYRMQQYFRYNRSNISEAEAARLVMGSQSMLYKLLPCERNSSYKSSLENYHSIINLCRHALQPKTLTP